MIEIERLTKRYGEKTAVQDLTFTVPSGQVTGFVGPNGAGKSTTMRMIVGLDRPSSGRAVIDGRRYEDQPAPLHKVGALLEARSVHRGRTARNHLIALAQTHGIPTSRVDDTLEMVGLTDAARRRVGAFSLGMGQRLGIASALLGDPEVVILDEPTNGLDPDGVLWIRGLLQALAEQGRTVLVSSHLMSEMALIAQHVVVIGRGQLLADTSVDELIARVETDTVQVRSPATTELRELLARHGATVASTEREFIEVRGLAAAAIGEIAAAHDIVLHELTPTRATLEDGYMELTREAVEYRTDERSGA